MERKYDFILGARKYDILSYFLMTKYDKIRRVFQQTVLEDSSSSSLAESTDPRRRSKLAFITAAEPEVQDAETSTTEAHCWH